MKIGIAACSANLANKTGVEWYTYYLIEALKKINLSNRKDLFVLYSGKPLEGSLALMPNQQWMNQILHWPFFFAWTQLRLSWEMISKSPDLLFVPGHVLPFIYSCRSINTCHDLGFLRYPQFYSYWQRQYLNWSIKYAIKRASTIIAISQFTKQELISIFHLKPEKIKVIYLGYNQQLYRPIQDKIKIKQILSKYKINHPYFLYLGRLEKKKNIANLIQGFEIFRQNKQINEQYQLALVGKPGYGYADFSDQLKQDSHILELGYCQQADLPYLYAGATAFVFPSWYEGFGIPLLEAAACQTPILASNIPSTKEIIKSGALYFDPYQPIELAQLMDKIIIDQHLAQQLIDINNQRIKQFSWEKCAQQTSNILTIKQ